MDSGKATKRNGMLKRLTVLMTIAGALILFTGVSLSAKEGWFQFRAVKTTGKATDSSGEMDPNTHEIHILYLVRFTTNTGKVVEFFEVVPGEPMETNTVLNVYYDPQNPKNARLITPGRWELPLQFLMAGGLLSCCAFGMGALTRKLSIPVALQSEPASSVP